jgi:hypothetical protein
MLLVFNGVDHDREDEMTIFNTAQQEAVQAALETGKLKKLMVW